jgi:peptidoglycan/xylan/chitin deacetylase (PgdA/CDA1 family)
MKKIILATTGIVIILAASFTWYLQQNYEVPILMYHSLDATKIGSYAALAPSTFRRQMQFIKQNGYNVVSLSDYCQSLKEKRTLPKKSLVITFDDGYKDNIVALKTLKELDYPATIFLIVERIGLPGYLELAEISAFLNNTKTTIGSHTLTGAYLPDVGPEGAKKEIVQSKVTLEKSFSVDVETFSYTIGGFTPKNLLQVKEAGYLCACTTNRGFSRILDRFALRRIKITERDLGIRLWAKLSGFYNAFRKLKKPY